MAKTAKIIIDLEDDEARKELEKLVDAFNKVDDSIEEVEKQSKKTSKTIKDNFDNVGDSIKKSEGNAKQMDSSLNKFGAKFITAEIGKKILEVADATLVAASAKDAITGKTKETAEQYVKMKENVIAVSEGVILTVANLGSSLSTFLNINQLLDDTAKAWREIAGLQQKETENMLKANAYNLQLAKVSELVHEYRTLSTEYEKYKDSNKNFADVAKKGMEDTSRAIATANNELAKHGKVLDESTLNALKLGQTETNLIRDGVWDKKKKQVEEYNAKVKSTQEAELARLKSIAENVKINYGTQSEIIDRAYEKEVKDFESAYKRKLITQEQFNDATVKALEKRNAQVTALDTEFSKSDNVSNTGGEQANLAYKNAVKLADINKARLDKELADEKSYRDELLNLRTISADTLDEQLSIETEKINNHYDELTLKYKDNVEAQTEIDKARAKELKDVNQKLMEAQYNAMTTFVGGFADLTEQMTRSNKKYAQLAKGVAVVEATINTLQGFTKALAMGGPLGFLTGAGVLASGMATVMSIKNQQFATGGIVQGTNTSSDSVPTMLTPGEIVLNKSQQKNLINSLNNNNSQTNSASSQPINISLSVGQGMNTTELKKLLVENESLFTRMVSQAINTKSLNSKQIIL